MRSRLAASTVADALHPAGQGMCQEAAEKFFRPETHDLLLIVMGAVLRMRWQKYVNA